MAGAFEVMSPGADPGAAETRANAWYALARAYDRPDVWPQGMEDLIRVAFAPLDGRVADEARAAAAVVGSDGDPAVDHARLFIGPFEVVVAPWASSYLDPEGRLMGPHSQYAANAYAEAGLGPREGPTDAPDHVTHELEFMYFLAFQEAATGEQEWGARQRRFWREHLGCWLPRFARAVADAGDGTFYGALGRLTGAFCSGIDAVLGPVPPPSSR